MDQHTDNGAHAEQAHSGQSAKQGGQSAQADLNKLVGSAKEATEGFELGKLFEGRIGNVQFLYFFVGALVLGLVLGMIPIIGILANIVLAVIGIGVGIRRFHDINVTGWASLVFFVPFIGLLVALYLCWKHGDAGDNQYGSAPDLHRPIFKAILNS